MQIDKILVRPMVTEKSLSNKENSIYLFEVARMANKDSIRGAVEALFKVKVAEVKTVVRKGKKRRVGRRMKSKNLSNTKIAYIKLKEGKIDLFPEK